MKCLRSAAFGAVAVVAVATLLVLPALAQSTAPKNAARHAQPAAAAASTPTSAPTSTPTPAPTPVIAPIPGTRGAPQRVDHGLYTGVLAFSPLGEVRDFAFLLSERQV